MTDLAAVYGKNLVLRRCVCWEPGENGAISAYVHSDYLTEGKASVLVAAVVSRPKALVHPVFQRLLKNSALEEISAEAAAKAHASCCGFGRE